MPRVLTNLFIDEVSCVIKGANRGSHVMLRKADDSDGPLSFNDVMRKADTSDRLRGPRE
jgi:hypothetical protein